MSDHTMIEAIKAAVPVHAAHNVHTTEALIAVAANIAPETNIPRALDALADQVEIEAASTFYRTPPLYRTDQPDYLNGAVRVATGRTARSLKFDVLRPLEAALGRVRGADRFAAREIDLDIAVFGSLVADEPGLRIPDPSLRTRAFLALPILELAPDLVLADTGERLADMAQAQGWADLAVATAFTQHIKARWDA